jgi:hypothetical protein
MLCLYQHIYHPFFLLIVDTDHRRVHCPHCVENKTRCILALEWEIFINCHQIRMPLNLPLFFASLYHRHCACDFLCHWRFRFVFELISPNLTCIVRCWDWIHGTRRQARSVSSRGRRSWRGTSPSLSVVEMVGSLLWHINKKELVDKLHHFKILYIFVNLHVRSNLNKR